MASGDLLDLAQAACRSAQMDPADTTGDLAQAKTKVNEAHLRCCNGGEPLDFLEREGQWTTVAGADVYTYASIAAAASITGATIREIHTLVGDAAAGTGVLESMSWEALEHLSYSSQETSEGTGDPQLWAKWGTRIRLYPTPDAVYTIGAFCYLTPSEMSLDADVPLLPLAWRHAVIVPYAAALLLEQEGGNEAAAGYDRLMQRYERNFLAMRTALAAAKRPTFRVMTPTAFSDLDSD